MPASGIALCRRCRRDVLPQLAQPSWHREKHRATQAEREPEPDPRADVIRRRKARKQSRASALRQQLRVHGLIAATKFFLSLKRGAEAPTTLPSLDCPDCLQLQASPAA